MTGHNVGPLTVPHFTIFLHRTACVYIERSCNPELLGFAPSNLTVASSRVFASSYTSSKQGTPCTLQPEPWFCTKPAVPLLSSPLFSSPGWMQLSDPAVGSTPYRAALTVGFVVLSDIEYAAHVANHFGVKAPSWGSSSADVSSSGCPSVSSTASCLPPPPPPPTSPPDSSAPDSPPR